MTQTASPADPLRPGALAATELDVAGYLRQWLAHARGRGRAVTYEGYEVLVRRYVLPRLGPLQLQELSPLDVQDLYSELLAGGAENGGLSAGTVLNLHLVLNQAFAQAVRWQLLAANPVAGAQPPRPRRPARLLVDPDLLELLLASVTGSWLEAPAAIAAATGMRRGEILALRWADLTGDSTAVRVQRTLQPTRQGLVFEQPKTARSRRTVLLPAFLGPYLGRQRDDQARRRAVAADWQEQGLVIDRGDGRPLNPDRAGAGRSGVALGERYIRDLLPGYRVFAERVTGSKLIRAQPVAAADENGLVKLVRGRRSEELLDELTAFPHGAHDDCCRCPLRPTTCWFGAAAGG